MQSSWQPLAMQSSWQPLLDAASVQLTDGSVSPADRARPFESVAREPVLALLPDYALLRLTGPDAARALQGQLTCDVTTISPARASLGAHCTPKGRMISSFILGMDRGGTFWLRLRAELMESAGRQLGKYLVFSKASLQPAPERLVLGLYGEQAAAALHACFGAAPNAGRFATLALEAGLLLQMDDTGQRFECWLTPAAALTLLDRCGDFTIMGGDFWRWLSIQAGMAELGAATSEQFIPQMLNYPLLGAVSFSKGCYTGQEIIARAHYRGQVKRHLLRAAIDGPAPAPGSDLHDTTGRVAGQVVDAVTDARGHAELLAVSAAGDGATLQTADGLTLQVMPLPYAIT